MDTFNVSSKSWHYRLATTYGFETQFDISNNNVDICSYSRSVVFGTISALLLTAAGVMIGAPVSQVLLWLGVCVVNNSFVDPLNARMIAVGMVEILGVSLYVVLSSLYKVIKKVSKKFPRKEKQETSPSFVVQAYHSFKDKYCVKVKQID